jgi:DNA-binding Xre family transcriptional regulator
VTHEHLAVLISQRLDAVMTRRGVSMAALAARGGPHENTISRILRAHDTRLSTLVTLAAALGCEVRVEIVPKHTTD